MSEIMELFEENPSIENLEAFEETEDLLENGVTVEEIKEYISKNYK